MSSARGLALALGVGALIGALSTLSLQELASRLGLSTRYQSTEFRQFLLSIAPRHDLVLAEVRTTEQFDRLSGARAFFDMIDLPSVEVRATVTALHRVILPLGRPDDFDLRADQGRLSLLAPALKIEDPSPDVSSLRLEVRRGSLMRDEASVLRELQDELSVLLKGRSHDHKELAREVARRELASLLRGWMRSTVPIDVHFADDPSPRAP